MAEPSQPAWVAETLFSGVIASFRMPRRGLESLLPSSVQAKSLRRTADARVLIAFGDHGEPAVHVASMRVRTGVRFHEVFFGLSCVVSEGQHPVQFVPLMYCDEPVSTWTGNALYGFSKHSASMEWLGESFVVSDARDGVVFQASWTSEGAWRSGPGMAMDWQSTPVLGRRRDGAYVMSRFDWEWAASRHRRNRCVVAFRDLVASSVSAVQVQNLRWRISWPELVTMTTKGVTMGHMTGW